MDRIGESTIRREVKRDITILADRLLVVWIAFPLPFKLLFFGILKHRACCLNDGDAKLRHSQKDDLRTSVEACLLHCSKHPPIPSVSTALTGTLAAPRRSVPASRRKSTTPLDSHPTCTFSFQGAPASTEHPRSLPQQPRETSLCRCATRYPMDLRKRTRAASANDTDQSSAPPMRAVRRS